jgi:PKD repeat protein
MNDIPNAPFGHVSGCGTEQGIYTGMLDIYSIGLPDMYIDLADVCNGNYYIVSITDPDNNFFETNDNNNWTAVPVTLTMQSTAITSGFNMSQSGSTVIFSNNTDLISYVWDFGDGNIDSTSNPVTHTYSTPGTYTVTLTQVNGCGTYTSTQVITITGIGETENFNEQLLQVFPNPATDVVTLQGIKPNNGAMVIELFSSTGQLVYSRTENNSGIGAYSISLNLASTGISEGAYILKVSTTEHYAVRKLIIQQK